MDDDEAVDGVDFCAGAATEVATTEADGLKAPPAQSEDGWAEGAGTAAACRLGAVSIGSVLL
jgi:hypothetical protein